MKSLAIFSALLISHYSYAQRIFEPGYVILNTGDSLSGYLSYNGAPAKFFELEYKNGGNRRLRLLPFADVVRFQVGDRYYNKQTVEIFEPLINPHNKTISRHKHQIECFLLRVAAGPIVDLYAYNGEKQRFFIYAKKKGDSLIAQPAFKQLLYWVPEDYDANNAIPDIDYSRFWHTEDKWVRRERKSLWFYGYLHQLFFLTDSLDYEPFQFLPYTETYLRWIVTYINTKVIPKEPVIFPRYRVKLFVGAGMGYNRFRLYCAHNETINTSFQRKVYPVVTMGVDLQAREDFSSLLTRFYLSLSRFQTGKGVLKAGLYTGKYTFDFDATVANISVSPNWRVDDNWGPFSLYAGPYLSLDAVFVNVREMKNEPDSFISNVFSPNFFRGLVTFGAHVMLRAEKFSITLHAPLVSSRGTFVSPDFVASNKQGVIAFSWNVFDSWSSKRTHSGRLKF
ncbi:hypothetical protein [[Flexibacter] sp. ATCC 35208]|uniref:hypothetical protein n=1 Tax=[Flexibacter] sp. ATCC 35208 TaxID=1936242 RepID=UPI0009D1F3C2|nr:hypothetical protein [[Flexibacter] sp. ATCC 35208]OMP80038.1 hypothetical protein BW716_05975 [[Flexibacter] sp. ATCC 35208]